MGIYDRDYIRDPPRRGAYGRPALSVGMWSVNTWIIVVCVGVFVIDSMLPVRLVPARAPDLIEGVTQVPRSATLAGDPETYIRITRTRDGEEIRAQHVHRVLLDAPGGRPIGWQDVRPMHLIESSLSFSMHDGFFRLELWRLIGFQFLHAHEMVLHIIFNMIGLYFFGPMVERYLGRKRYLAFYLLCGIFGALAYVLLNLGGILAGEVFQIGRIPGLIFDSPYTPLIGASAGVFGVLMAGAYLAPETEVLVMFIPMRLRTLAYGLVAIAFFTVLTGGANAGGEAAHLGGAAAGYYFVRHTRHLHGFFDFLGWADPTSHHYRGRRRRRGKKGAAPDPDEINRILDKITASGMSSLTDQERRILASSQD